MAFQVPNGVGPQRVDIGASIDALFNAYARDKAEARQQASFDAEQQDRQRQIALQNIEQTATFGAPASQFTPQDLQAAQQPAPGPGTLGPNMGITPPEAPHVAALRNYLDMKKNALALGAQQAQAGLAKTQAEAQKAGAEASLTGAQAGLLNGSEGIVSHYVDQIKAGNMTMDDLSNLGRGDVANAVKLGVGNALAAQGVNVNSLNNQQAANKSGAELSGGGSSQEMARSANSAYKQFDLLQQASDNFGRTNSQLLNTPLLKIDATKYPEAQVFKTALSTARIEYARAASGSKSPSDTFMEEAKAALPDGITPKQIGPVLNQLRNSLSEQTRGQLTPATVGNAPPLVDQKAAGGNKPPPAPRVGAVVRGYRFSGGNPALPASWAKL
jgi:hypothetical protein